MRSAVRQAMVLAAALLLLPAWAAAQEPASLTGQVTTSSGQPLPGATITVEGMNLGTLTNIEGRYLLVIPASRLTGQEIRLTAVQLGYKPMTQTITPRAGMNTLDFALAEDPLRLEEIVVTGQGTTQERQKLGVAINTVDAEEITSSNEPNVVAALAGKAPNVEVTSNAGDPGAGAYIRIRGAASIVGGTQPLIVVDGTPIDNSERFIEAETAGTVVGNGALDLNPADIESIDILKGAAAAALYGSRAANGVVLITTKSGRPGQTRFTYSTNYSFNEVNATVPLQRRFGQGQACGAHTLAEQATLGCTSPMQDLAPTTSISWGEELGNTPTYDHATEALQNGGMWENNLSFSGGSDRTTYYLSLGRLDHEGTIVGNQKYNRSTVRLKGTHAFTDNLRIGGNLAYTDGVGDFIQHGSNVSGIWLAALRSPPEFNNQPYLDPATGLHRSYRAPNPTTLASSRGYDNPFWIANEILNTADVGRAFGNISADYSPAPWLSFSLVVGGDYRNDERMTLFPKSSSAFPLGQLIRANFVDLRYDESLTATATHQLNDDISGSLTLGQNLNHTEFRRYQVDGSNVIFGAEELDFTVTPTPDEFKETVRTDGYFGQAQVDLYNLLTLTGNLRLDGSNTFGGGDKRFLYPGVSASFRFQDLVGLEQLNFGRVRASWGVTGRQPPAFSNISAFNKAFFDDGWLGDGIQSIYGGQEGVVTVATAGNPDIEPERESEFEVGLDLAFLDERVALGLTYYDRTTEDAILQKPVPPSTGYSFRWENAASWWNKGIEATLDLFPIRTDNFSWSVGGQWATNESCVTDLAGATELSLAGFTGSTTSLVAPDDPDDPDGTCHEWGVFYMTDFARFGRGEVVGGVSIDQAFPGAPDGTLYIAANGSPVQSAQQWVSGNPNPDWTAGIRSTLTFYNRLRVSGLLDIRQGQEMWNGTQGALFYFGTHRDAEPYQELNTDGPWAGRIGLPHVFDGEGPGAGTEVLLNWTTWTTGLGNSFTGPDAPAVEDASYMKLREISVSYSLPVNWLRPLGFAAADITLAGRNLATWTDYSGIDPESNLQGNDEGRGIDYFNNPQTRSWVIGVTLTR
jgi:TonB-linked SusC/RagA family outer membrane protein